MSDMHRMTVRISEEAWARFEQVLATNNLTASAYFEASACFIADIADANGGLPYQLWETTVTETSAEGWKQFFERARQIDVARRSRRPDITD